MSMRTAPVTASDQRLHVRLIFHFPQSWQLPWKLMSCRQKDTQTLNILRRSHRRTAAGLHIHTFSKKIFVRQVLSLIYYSELSGNTVMLTTIMQRLHFIVSPFLHTFIHCFKFCFCTSSLCCSVIWYSKVLKDYNTVKKPTILMLGKILFPQICFLEIHTYKQHQAVLSVCNTRR